MADKMASLIQLWGLAYVGQHGFSDVGMVVGATYPGVAAQMRRLAPTALFLMPGMGAQGGSLDAIVAGSGPRGIGAYAASSRGLLYPFDSEALTDAHWADHARARMGQAASDLRRAIQEKLVSS